MVILLIGPPGSGKGTQGQLLEQKLNLSHISIGDIFREIAKLDNKEGLLIQNYMAQGKLIPSELVNEIVKNYLFQDKYKNGYILDGYPRNIEQASFFCAFNKQDIKTLFFEVDEQIIIKRILGRFSCANCGQIYNQYFVMPKVDNVCDVCGSKKFIYRKDDEEQTIKNRIVEYKKETYPLGEYLKDKSELYIIDASKEKQEIATVLDKILKII